MFGSTAMGVPREEFDDAMNRIKVERTAPRLGLRIDASEDLSRTTA